MRMIWPAILVAIAVLSGAATAPEQNLCERLAPEIGFKRVWLSSREGDIEEWRVNNAKFGDYLVGATIATSIGLEPDDGGEATGDDYRRFAEMCKRTSKGAECQVVGRARLKLGTRRGETKLIAKDGERAIVGIRGTTVYCRRL